MARLSVLGPFAALLAVLACGDEASSPVSPSAACSAVRSDTAPKITIFTASQPIVEPGDRVVLSFAVEGACVTTITGPSGTLVSTFASAGTVTTPPLDAPTTFVLEAEAAGARVSSSTTVDVVWADPEILSFTAEPAKTVVGGTVLIRYVTRRATHVRIYRDGVVADSRDVPADQHEGSLGPEIVTAPEVVYRLEASNPSGTYERRLVVTSGDVPFIDGFEVDKSIFIGPVETATVTWATRHATEVQLLVDEVLVPSFSGAASGTMTLSVDRPATVKLVAIAGGGIAFSEHRIEGHETEREPNDSWYFAQDISARGTVLGAIDAPDDPDFYRFQPFAPGRVRLVTSGRDNLGCNVDTRIDVLDDQQQIVASATGGGARTEAGGECAVIEVDTPSMGRSLFVEVRSEQGATGEYLLYVRAL